MNGTCTRHKHGVWVYFRDNKFGAALHARSDSEIQREIPLSERNQQRFRELLAHLGVISYHNLL